MNVYESCVQSSVKICVDKRTSYLPLVEEKKHPTFTATHFLSFKQKVYASMTDAGKKEKVKTGNLCAFSVMWPFLLGCYACLFFFSSDYRATLISLF